MRNEDEEEYYHHEVQSDEEIAIIEDPHEAKPVRQKPEPIHQAFLRDRKRRRQAPPPPPMPENCMIVELEPYEPPAPPPGPKSFKSMFQRKLVRTLQKCTEQMDEDDAPPPPPPPAPAPPPPPVQKPAKQRYMQQPQNIQRQMEYGYPPPPPYGQFPPPQPSPPTERRRARVPTADQVVEVAPPLRPIPQITVENTQRPVQLDDSDIEIQEKKQIPKEPLSILRHNDSQQVRQVKKVVLVEPSVQVVQARAVLPAKELSKHICTIEADIDDGPEYFLPEEFRDLIIEECRQRGTLKPPATSEKQQLPNGPSGYWNPVVQVGDIPTCFYMNKKFCQPAGIAFDPVQLKNTYDAFRMFFTNEVYQLIIEQTNERAVKCGSGFRMTEGLLDGYLATQIYLGMTNFKKYEHYWTKLKQVDMSAYTVQQELFEMQTQLIASLEDEESIASKIGHIMDRLTYDDVRRFLRIHSKGGQGVEKTEQLSNLLNLQFKKHYKPEEFLVLDESTLSYKKKVKKELKGAKRTLKEYSLCDSQRSYTLELRYSDHTPPDLQSWVMSMLTGYKETEHKVVMDQSFVHTETFMQLKQLRIGALGPVRLSDSRLGADDVQSQHFQMIQPPYRQHVGFITDRLDSVLMCQIDPSDNECAMLSNFVDLSLKREHIPNSGQETYMRYLFNTNFAASIDRNAIISIWSQHNRQQKSWNCVFDRLVQTAIANAAILMRMVQPPNTTGVDGWLRDFRRALMHEMIVRSHKHNDRWNPHRTARNVARRPSSSARNARCSTI